jgi:putative oxidoreductase
MFVEMSSRGNARDESPSVSGIRREFVTVIDDLSSAISVRQGLFPCQALKSRLARALARSLHSSRYIQGAAREFGAKNLGGVAMTTHKNALVRGGELAQTIVQEHDFPDAANKSENGMRPIDFSRWGSLPIRLLVGFGFIAHGFAKLTAGPDAFAGILQQLNVPLPHVAAWLTIGTELIGGFATLLGGFVSWVSIPMAVVLLVAMFSVHLPYGFSSVRLLSVSASGAKFGPVGYELDLLYLAAIVTLVLQGAGPLSIDRIRGNRSKPS